MRFLSLKKNDFLMTTLLLNFVRLFKGFFLKMKYILTYPREYLISRNQIFIVYTMGKVGSVTVEEMLKRKLPFSKVFHTHFLTEKGVIEQMEFSKSDSGVILAQKIKEELNVNKMKRVKFITLVREPVSRDISDLFENYSSYFPGLQENGLNFDNLMNKFRSFDFNYTLEWLDRELKGYLGIDIFSYPFDKSSGYSVFHFKEFDLMILRLEDLSRVFEKSMTEFTGTGGWKLSKMANTAENKSYFEIYHKFKSNVKLERELLEKIYTSKYFRHFYTDSEAKEYFEKWVRS